jgi:quercetin dioxygenase-like cupin family protein
MQTESAVRHYRWKDVERERVTDLLDRQLITGDRVMLAHVHLKKGCVVPRHSHENEQLTWILEGALRFWIGEDGAEEIVVNALEDTLDVDIFSPPREDWLNHTDSYFHQK